MIQDDFSILNRINKTVKEISEELQPYEVFQDLCRNFLSIPPRMKEPMQLAIVGKISSSKSTLVNTMLGQAEVVRTGAMEETWNVSWLKYGDPRSDLIVHFKDGHEEKVRREEWNKWANREREQKDRLKNTVSYIEVAYDHEILKEINIIDTPGLDSFYGADSQNTLDFLKQVHPDAVIMLFSKSINADTLSVIEDFRQGVGTGFLPLNAMGVMSKIDDIWASDPELNPLAEGKRVVGGLMSLEIVKNTLFNIYPLSALVALSAFEFDDEDMNICKELISMGPERLSRLLRSERRFLSNDEAIPVSPEVREALLKRFGRYGIHLVTDHLFSFPGAERQDIQEMLLSKSGFNEFMEVVKKHFGQRATLIKIYSTIFNLTAQCHKQCAELYRKNDGTLGAERVILDSVCRKVDELMNVLSVEFARIGMMIEIYEGKVEMEPDDFDELRRVSGEYGASCIERTGMDHEVDIEAMETKVLERIGHWTYEYNSMGDLFPTRAKFMKLLVRSYTLLLHDIRSAKYKLRSANEFLFGKIV